MLTILALVLLSSATPIAAEANVSEPYINHRLPTHINPFYHMIELHVGKNDNFTGHCIITLKATENAKNITLNSANEHLNITNVTLTYKYSDTIEPIKTEKVGELLIFHFDQELIGTYDLSVKYESKLQDVSVSRDGLTRR